MPNVFSDIDQKLKRQRKKNKNECAQLQRRDHSCLISPCTVTAEYNVWNREFSCFLNIRCSTFFLRVHKWEEFSRLQTDSFWLASPSERSELPECSCSLKSLCPREHNAEVCLAHWPSLSVMQYSWQHTHIIFRRKRPWMPPQIKLQLDIFYYVPLWAPCL